MTLSKNNILKIISLALLILWANELFAHVKWFTSFDFLDKSKETTEVANMIYWGLVALSILVISILIFLDRKMEQTNWSKKMNKWLDNRQKYSLDVIRIAMFAVLIISWVNSTILTPELNANNTLIPWTEFIIALLLLIPSTISLAGGLILLLYGYCIYKFGFFYMLDYLHFLGISIYLMTAKVQNERIKSIGIPALYITLGFALVWLAFEKLYYPAWSLYLLEQNPQLALGLPHDFFLQGAAFVEIGLGFMLLFGALERPLAGLITIVFITTSIIFGKTEVIGHTSLHAMLIVFILKGTGNFYNPPIDRWTKITWKRIVIAIFSYIILTTTILFVYKQIANYQYNIAIKKAKEVSANEMVEHSKKMLDVSNLANKPEFIEAKILEEPHNMGYNIYVKLKNWTFTPENVGKPYKQNQGHIHIYVDGKKAGRMYSNWFYLGKLSKGKHKVVLTINGDDHTAFTIDNKMIGIEREILVK